LQANFAPHGASPILERIFMPTPHEYARTHAGQFLEQLKAWIRIPSVSTLPEHTGDVTAAAEWLANDLRRIGMNGVEVVETEGHPVVYAEWLGAGPNAPTVLIYGHYDVQPAEVENGWHSAPFEPTERDGKLYARGASDDKGQAFAQVKAVESLLAGGNAPVNIKLIVEGEEEMGSPHLGRFVAENAARLAADVCVISDTAILTREQPSVIYALRGLIYMEVHVTGPSRDLHSGIYGGTVHNPAQALCEIIASLHNPDGSINIPGFYDDVLTLSESERGELSKTNWTEDHWRESTGAPMPWGEPGYTFRERTGARPTLEVNGLLSGFTGEGSKTVLPAKAMAKISCRLVANQSAQKMYTLVRDHIAHITPPTVRSEVRLLNEGEPAFVDLNTPAVKAAIAAYERGWGQPPVFMREGGSIPVVADFQRILKLPVILMGFGLDTDGAHGPDEHFHIDMFHKGIDTAIYFLQEVGAQGRTR
jgi:acetylornithine deacetylase/succinyl-diaminopimelate desuccinylase-like protein